MNITGGLATAGTVNLAIQANEANSALTISGAASANFTTTNIGSVLDTSGALTVNTTGTAALGNTTLAKDEGTGLAIQNGTVTATSLNVQGQNHVAHLVISGGSFTIGNSSSTGGFEIATALGQDGGTLVMSGGSLTYLGTDGLLMSTTNGITSAVTISSGTATLTGITLNAANAAATTSTLTLSGGVLYLGGVGLVLNMPSATVTATIGTATVGAIAPWDSFAPITLNNKANFQTANASGSANNITLSGLLSGTGTLTASGAGILILTDTESYTGATTINGGATLQLGDGTAGDDGTISTTSSLTDNGTLIYNRSGALSSSLVIGGTGNVTVSGTGSETLIGINTYTGATTINGGATLQLGDGTSSADDGTIATSSGILDNGTLIYNRYGTPSSGVAISGSGAVVVSGQGTQVLTGTNTYTGPTTINGISTLQLGNGAAGNDGNITASSGILDNGTLIFDRSGAVSSGVPIGGSGNVQVSGAGSQILTGVNTYNGVTTISTGATLQLGDGTPGDDGTIEDTAFISDNGTLIFDRSGALSSAVLIAGNGGVQVSGTGSQTLTTTDNYHGATVVNQGRLIVSGSLTATVSASVASGAHLEVDGLLNNSATVAVTGFLNGTGSTGPVTVESGGTLGPGRSTITPALPGTLTAGGNVAFTDSTSRLSIRLGVASPADSDQLDVAPGDTVSLGGATLSLTLGSAFQPQADGFIYVLINGGTATTGNIIGTFAQGSTFTDADGDVYNILYNVSQTGIAGAGNDVDLQVLTSSIPEPPAWPMMLAGAGLLGIWRRSRRSSRLDL